MIEFYLHEDEWGMTSLEPIENLANRQGVVSEAAAHSAAHRAPDGIGWTAMYVAPDSPISIATRAITVDALAAALGPTYLRATQVVSGYSSFREIVDNGFALLWIDSRHENVFYGTESDGVITSLAISRPGAAIADTLYALGTTYRLLLCDLWTDVTFALSDRAELDAFLADEE